MSEKTKIKFLSIIITCLFAILVSCDADHGIAPKQVDDTEFGFGGNIIFYGEWPDSIKRMFLVVFKDPLLDDDDFVITNMGYLSIELPLEINHINIVPSIRLIFH